ncbi:D-arabinono-1,4-lactone oxidase [Botryobacter ruber]|uniref:D-arabinono-1,4-lactone oxidase n=1 Tax=Botryobacter ruber TaxID=2171629 RepID=UPI000E0BE7D9|nr:D-arabinono-1,4-lactone oxidase [Botryobacter ruber]
MAEEWINWSGSVRFTPEKIKKPDSETALQKLVLQALADKKQLRIVGAGHSSMPLVKTDQLLVSQEKLKGITGFEEDKLRVKLLPGTSIREASEGLIKLNTSLHNTGDIDMQYLAGAFGTGTHGSGRKLKNLSSMLVGCRLVDGRGDLKTYTLEEHPEMIRAARVSLGSLGFMTELTIQVEPAQQFLRKEYCTHTDTSLAHLHELIETNRMFDLYWYPRSDLTKLRICNPVGEGMQDIPFGDLVKEQEGWLYEVLPRFRYLKYEEMEYAVPFEAGPECFREIRKRIKEKHRHYVGWRVLYRTIAADDACLSPFYNRDSVTIAVLQNHELEYKKYFDDLEPIFRAYDGRPHWGKKHTLKAPELKQLYPEWDRFLEIRKQMDPEGIFLNDHLKEIFGL